MYSFNRSKKYGLPDRLGAGDIQLNFCFDQQVEEDIDRTQPTMLSVFLNRKFAVLLFNDLLVCIVFVVKKFQRDLTE